MTVRELSDIKSVKEIKQVIFDKLQDENCCFTKKDIHIEATDYGYKIWITDYEHCTFYLHFEYDNEFFFEYETWVCEGSDDYPNDREIICLLNSKTGFRTKEALLNIGYTIGTTF